jgi:hypothetical protein
MSVDSWSIFWKIVFIIGVGTFAVLTVFVIVGGARDISTLIQRLKKEGEDPGLSDSISDEE